MRPNKGSNVALVALISLVVGASYHRLWRPRNNRRRRSGSRTRARRRGPRRGRSATLLRETRAGGPAAPLSSQGPRRRIKELGAWETVLINNFAAFEFCESSKATRQNLI